MMQVCLRFIKRQNAVRGKLHTNCLDTLDSTSPHVQSMEIHGVCETVGILLLLLQDALD